MNVFDAEEILQRHGISFDIIDGNAIEIAEIISSYESKIADLEEELSDISDELEEANNKLIDFDSYY